MKTVIGGEEAERALMARRARLSRLTGPWLAGLLALLVPALVGGCAAGPSKPPPVPAFNYPALTTTLNRGVSTPADVRAVLGEPQGAGGFLDPAGTEEHDLWFYQKLKVDMSWGKLDVQQDMLLVFFRAGRFDGFLWFSDARKDWRESR